MDNLVLVQCRERLMKRKGKSEVGVYIYFYLVIKRDICLIKDNRK